MNLKVELETGNAVCVRISGHVVPEQEFSRREPLGESLGDAVYGRRVLLDFRQVEMLNSCGVSWLLNCLKRFRDHGGKLVLCGLPAAASNVLKVLNLTSMFAIAQNEQEGFRLLEGESTP